MTMKVGSKCLSTTMALSSTALLLLLWSGVGSAQIVSTAIAVKPHAVVMCEDLRLRCAFADGCGVALHNYFLKCDKMLQTEPTSCPDSCLYALVALTSTVEGKSMMECTCREQYCEQMKSRVEVCRPLVVEASKNNSIVSCELAQWICMVDPVCSSALNYYDTYCKRVLSGSPCTERCLNSVEILRRQEKAHKMNRCWCAGQTAAQCLREKERMVRLCYGGDGDLKLQQQAGGSGGNKSGGVGRKYRKKHRPRMFDMDPDKAEVEMMMADPLYEPDVRNRYNATFGAKGSAPAVRASPVGIVLCSVLHAVAAVLVTRSSLFCSG